MNRRSMANQNSNSQSVVAFASVNDMSLKIRQKSQLKGRQADEASLQEVRALLLLDSEVLKQRRDLLIEQLHALNDSFRGLHERHLVALAKLMNIPMAEVYEVATFYHHFEVIREGEQAPQFTLRVCDGLSCEMAGAATLLNNLKASLGTSKVKVVSAPCVGRCEQAPVAVVHQHEVGHARNTPTEGWHDAVSDLGMTFKGYLNVIEDIRIEKKIKNTYPGLRKSFYSGYNELGKMDFFGLTERNQDVSELGFIDRINLHYKLGAQCRVQFSDEEMVYIKR